MMAARMMYYRRSFDSIDSDDTRRTPHVLALHDDGAADAWQEGNPTVFQDGSTASRFRNLMI